MADAVYQGLPFEEAISFFRGKVNIPTERWNDLWQGMHARGFMVAGAMKDEILIGFRDAVDKAISKGTTLAEFQKDFDNIVTKTGWTYNGTRGWRSKTIYENNLFTAYQAGRYAQMTDPDTLKARPNWEYHHGDSVNPRRQHLAWNNLVLAADDPWWDSHYPPNGWGCKCTVFALSDHDLSIMGKSGPDTAPPTRMVERQVKQYDPESRKMVMVTHQVPEGIDPGWDYNVGQASLGKRLSDQAMDEWRALGGRAWKSLTPGDWESEKRPETVPVDSTQIGLGPKCTTVEQAVTQMTKIFGYKESNLTTPGLNNNVHLDAQAFAEHVDLGRSPYFPFLSETITDPYEVWMSFEQHLGTKKVELRTRYIKCIDTGDKQGMLFVAQARGGQFEAWTLVPTRDLKQINRNRRGKLIWKR